VARRWQNTLDEIQVFNYPALDDHDIFTFAFWLYIDGVSPDTTTPRLIRFRKSAGGSSFFMFHDETAGNIRVQTARWDGGVGRWVFDEPATLAAWNHILVTYDYGSTANEPIVYLNGSVVGLTQENTPTGTVQTDDSPDVFIGNSTPADFGSTALNGRMAEVAYWSRILNDDEAQSVLEFSPIVQLGGLVMYLPMYGSQSPEPNLVGPVNGTLTGTSLVADSPPVRTVGQTILVPVELQIVPDKPMRWPVQRSLTHGRDLWDGLVVCFPFWPGGDLEAIGPKKDLFPTVTLEGDAVWSGNTVDCSGTTAGTGIDCGTADPIPEGGCTIMFAAEHEALPAAGDFHQMVAKRDAFSVGNMRWHLAVFSVAGTPPGQVRWASAVTSMEFTVGASTGKHVWILTDDNTNSRFYEDGLLRDTKGSLTFDSDVAAVVSIGRNEVSGTENWEGEIDVVAFWDRPLSAAEVAFMSAFPYALFDPRGGKLGIVRRR
jgi:hypothetical protein